MVLMCLTFNSSYRELEQIIQEAINNPIRRVKGKTHKHHIIPRTWYKLHKLEEDNSPENLVTLTYENHCRVHELLCKCLKDEEMIFRMRSAYAILKNWKPTVDKPQKIEKIKEKKRNRGYWKNYINSHIDNLLNFTTLEEQIKYLNELNPNIEHQVLKKIIDTKLELCSARRMNKKLKNGKISKIDVLNLLKVGNL